MVFVCVLGGMRRASSTMEGHLTEESSAAQPLPPGVSHALPLLETFFKLAGALLNGKEEGGVGGSGGGEPSRRAARDHPPPPRRVRQRKRGQCLKSCRHE